MSNQKNEGMDLELGVDELTKMLQDKTLENVKLLEDLAKAKNELATMKVRALKVHEDNLLLKADPEVARLRAVMEYELSQAERFIQSKAFPKGMTPEQAYVISQAGKEMGMGPAESLNSLYIVNGSIDFYGKALTSVFKSKGYSVEYMDETSSGLVVRVYNEETGEDYREAVSDQDQILKHTSKAMKFAKKNKMRYHGLRMIMAFHLADQFRSVADPFQGYAHQQLEADNQKRIGSPDQDKKKEQFLAFINSPDRTADQLQSVFSTAADLGLEDTLQERLDSLKPDSHEEE